MKRRNRAWIVLATTGLSLAAACGPSAAPIGETDSEGSSGTTADPTNPDPTTPPMTTDPSVGTGDVTGSPTTDPATTDPPDDTTTTGPTTDSCCEAHDDPGCNESDVVECVCSVEASCCAFEWSQACVDLATGKCMATCEDPTDTGDDTTTGVGTECTELVQIEMLPSEASYDGAWELGMSMVGEGEISVNQTGGPGSFTYEPDIPCDDTWYIWARAFDQGQNDSYFATLDGEPMPPAIFEGGCTGAGNGYVWAVLNWRDEADGPCVYVEDPWAPEWAAGVHQIQFSFRESQAMGRIVITNDQDFVPM
jgi:hypothetical protein